VVNLGLVGSKELIALIGPDETAQEAVGLMGYR
jgi:hypothetical protein